MASHWRARACQCAGHTTGTRRGIGSPIDRRWAIARLACSSIASAMRGIGSRLGTLDMPSSASVMRSCIAARTRQIRQPSSKRCLTAARNTLRGNDRAGSQCGRNAVIIIRRVTTRRSVGSRVQFREPLKRLRRFALGMFLVHPARGAAAAIPMDSTMWTGVAARSRLTDDQCCRARTQSSRLPIREVPRWTGCSSGFRRRGLDHLTAPWLHARRSFQLIDGSAPRCLFERLHGVAYPASRRRRCRWPKVDVLAVVLMIEAPGASRRTTCIRVRQP